MGLPDEQLHDTQAQTEMSEGDMNSHIDWHARFLMSMYPPAGFSVGITGYRRTGYNEDERATELFNSDYEKTLRILRGPELLTNSNIGALLGISINLLSFEFADSELRRKVEDIRDAVGSIAAARLVKSE